MSPVRFPPRSLLRRLVGDESGAVAPFVILLLPVLLGFAALVLDVGMLYANRRSLQNAADAAALAGTRELQRELLGASGANPGGLAQAFAARNGVPAGAYGDCAADGSARIVRSQPGSLPQSWEVQTSRRVDLRFAGVLGLRTQCVRARALAVVSEIDTAKVWPWGVLDGLLPTVGYGKQVVLKEGAGGSSSGNFGIVDFTCGGGGTPDYEYWATSGYGSRPGERVPVRLPGPTPWSICTETGNKAAVNKRLEDWVATNSACRFGEPDLRCALYGMVPVLQERTWPNGTKRVNVIYLAIFKLRQVQVVGGKTEITGEFVRYAGGVGPTFGPAPAGTHSGVIGVRLWQ